MTKKEFMELIDKYAMSYCDIATESVIRNSHMNDFRGNDIPQDLVDAIIVNFVNYIGYKQGLDYGMHTYDLRKDI